MNWNTADLEKYASPELKASFDHISKEADQACHDVYMNIARQFLGRDPLRGSPWHS